MNRRAFTLVELLVVIAIIGLLSTIAVVSLGQARIKARDTKRMADLKQISTAVEFFYNDKGYLPTNTTGWGNIFWGSQPQFITDITPHMPNLPVDPRKPKQVGDYFYIDLNNTTGKYTLCAIMENPTGNSYDYTGYWNGSIYNYCIYPNGT